MTATAPPRRPEDPPHVWRNVAAFYHDVRRADSPEIDLGKWYFESHQPPVRATFIPATGELAIVREDADAEYVEVVGWFTDEKTMRKALDCKAIKEAFGRPKSVYALRNVCRLQGVAGRDVTENLRQLAHGKFMGAATTRAGASTKHADQFGLF